MIEVMSSSWEGGGVMKQVEETNENGRTTSRGNPTKQNNLPQRLGGTKSGRTDASTKKRAALQHFENTDKAERYMANRHQKVLREREHGESLRSAPDNKSAQRQQYV